MEHLYSARQGKRLRVSLRSISPKKDMPRSELRPTTRSALFFQFLRKSLLRPEIKITIILDFPFPAASFG